MSQSMPEPNSPLPGRPLSSDDALPPVEPPSAAFLIQLFVIPAVIVALIVLVWLAVTWLARGGDDPRQYFDALQRSGPARFQAAEQLATILAGERYEDFKRDDAAAQQLGEILQAEIAAASMHDQDIKMRYFLCKALGEFYVAGGVPALLKAATTQRASAELLVRLAAIESLAVLAEHLQQQESPRKLDNPEVATTLLLLSQDTDLTIRYTTAVAMGAIGTEQLVARLKYMLADENIEVTYNAATSLARQGDLSCVPTLLKMLGPEQAEAIAEEKSENDKEYKKLSIHTAAMRAVMKLKQKQPQADLTDLIAAIEELRDAEINTREANKTLEALEKIQPDSASKPQ